MFLQVSQVRALIHDLALFHPEALPASRDLDDISLDDVIDAIQVNEGEEEDESRPNIIEQKGQGLVEFAAVVKQGTTSFGCPKED